MIRWSFSPRVPLVPFVAALSLLAASRPAVAQPGTVTLSGRVTDPAGPGVAGVTVTIATTVQVPPAPATTDATGRFTIGGLAPGVYTATPSGAGLAYTPASRAVTLLNGAAVVDFVGAPITHAIAGSVLDANGTPVSGITMTLDGSAPATTTTDARGRYRFATLPPGGAPTVTPTGAGITFAPVSQRLDPLDADVELAPFVVATGRFERYLAEGVTNAFFDTRIALLNPTTQPTVARLSFQTSSGRVVEHQVPLAAMSRTTVDPRAVGVGDADFSTVIESSQPLVVDRTVRWDSSGYGSHAESSLPSPQTTWYFAEGATTGAFNLFYLLQNPGPNAATVSIRYLRPAPLPPIEKAYTVLPASRRTIFVNAEDAALDEAEISAVVTSTNGVPILAERAMYASIDGQVFAAGHESAGLPAPSAQWFLAEGATGPFFHQFVLVANPTSTPAPLEVRYLLTDGRLIVRRHTAAANSRLTIGVHADAPELASAAMSTIVTSTDGVPVLVERAMWWPASAPAWYEAHGSAGATATGTVWATAGGEAGGDGSTETFLLIANTGGFAGSARVTLIFEDGGTASRTIPLLPSSRRTVAVGAEFPEAAGRRFGAIVESLGAQPAPVVVERAIYSNAGGVVWAAGSNLVATRLAGRPAVPLIEAVPQQPGTIAPPVTVAGILGGDPESPAVVAIPDVIAEEGTPAAEISRDAADRPFARTKLEIGFARTATTAQVNAVLDAIGGRIVNAVAGVAVLTVRIPDPGSLEALEAVVARVRGLAAVRSVALVTFPAGEALPDTYTPTPADLRPIDHLIAARAPAAWNAAAALDDPSAFTPRLVVEDFFGDGPPNEAVVASLVPGDFGTGALEDHGYHVLATILGTFSTVGTLNAGPNRVVGLFPRTAAVRVYDIQDSSAEVPSINNALIRFVRNLSGPVVVSSSTGFETPMSAAEVLPMAVNWIEKVRTAGPGGTSLEGKFLHVKAAGNDFAVHAALTSDIGAAALLGNLVDADGNPVSNLTNTLIVENVLNTPAEPFEPGCRSFTSNTGGTIAAVGTAVFSLTDAGANAGDLTGTSMATPQVSALALYVWSLAPTLAPDEVILRLRRTARPGVPQTDPECSTVARATAPAIDAYAAVLTADDGLASPLVRRTLLDVVDAGGAAVPDGRFDQQDVTRFLAELDARAGTAFDYSRFDLNGDGRTGGEAVARFDLDATAPPAWTVLNHTIETTPLTFDEARLTDLRILCFYAYSALYDGDATARTTLLGSRCRPPAGAQITHHDVQMRVETLAVIPFITTFVRPNRTTEFVTPFEPSLTRNDSGPSGTASIDTAIDADDVTADPTGHGFSRAELQWRAECRAEASAIPLSATQAVSEFVATLLFTITDPNATVTVQGVLPSLSFPFDNAGTASAFLSRSSGVVGSAFNDTPVPLPFSYQAQGAGSYALSVRGKAWCLSTQDLPGVSQRLEVLSVTVGIASSP